MSQSPASATVTPNIFAGNGSEGYNTPDSQAATNAKLYGPYGLAVGTDGTVYFADKYNHIARKIDTSSPPQISTLFGTPQTCKYLPNQGLCQPQGVAVTAGGGVYVSSTNNNTVWYVASGVGGAVVGNDCGAGGFGGDGYSSHSNCTDPHEAKLNHPTGLAYDDASSTLYIADTYNCRVRQVVNGTITTVAGNGTCNTGGLGDGGSATSASVYNPTALAVGGGKLYIGGTDSRVRVVDLSTHVITTLSGSNGLSSPQGLAVDTVGNVYLGTSDGVVRRIDPSGSVHTVASITGSILSLARDPVGNVLVGTMWNEHIYKITGYNSGASISGISAAVTPSDPMYAMDVNFNLSGVSCPATAKVTIGTSAPRYKPLCGSGGTAPASASLNALSVLSLNPETSYPIKVTVDDANGTSPVGTGTLTTPKVPVFVAVGDSYSSGHHQGQDEPCNTNGLDDTHSYDYALAAYAANGSWAGTCIDASDASTLTPNDSDWSWVTRARNQLMTQLSVPSQWQMLVLDLARSGALAQNYIKPGDDTTCNGCGEKDAMVSALQARAGSWNIVTVEGGANDANFGGRLQDFYTANLGQGRPWAVSNRSACPDTDKLDGDILATRDAVRQALSGVLTTAQQTDPNVRRVLLTYPYILNPDDASSVCGGDSDSTAPHIGAFHAMDDLDNTVTGASVTGVQQVELRTASGFTPNPLNDIQQTRYFGFPHANSAGQDAIATAVVGRLTS